MATKQRWKNYALWASLVSQVLLAVQLIGAITGTFTLTDVMQEGILTAGNVVLSILATLGIISNPTKPDGKGFNL